MMNKLRRNLQEQVSLHILNIDKTNTLMLLIKINDLGIVITPILPIIFNSNYAECNTAFGHFQQQSNIVSVSDKPLPNMKSGFVVDTVGCRIPDLDPFDPVVRQFIFKEKPLKCHEKQPLLVDSNLTSLFIVKSALSFFNISDLDQLHCCYQPFWTTKPRKADGHFDNKIAFSNNCTSFKESVSIQEEFVKVSCYVDNQNIYRNYHAFISLKPEVEKRCQKVRDSSSTGQRERVSVLVVGMDSVSRLNFHRQLPRTLKILQNMKAIELLGYNKVADNTFPNLIPVLSGLSEKELKDVDECNWVWKNFSAAGYRTVFGEDDASNGIFTFAGRRFKKQPTDYYPRPYIMQSGDDIGFNKKLYTKLCLGSQMTFSVFLHYISKFAITMASKDFFGFFWSITLTHDFLNLPNLGDGTFEQFLLHLNETGSLNRTVLILMSDHGIRWGSIRETYQGRMEERLPFVFITLPEWFKNKYPTAIADLHRNTQRLTTSFDLYETLLDLVNLDQIEQDSIQRRSIKLNKSKQKPRGISLFLPIHKSRTCNEAGIVPHWCTCQRSKVIPVGDAIIKNMSLILVEHLNALLKPYGECSQLQLAEIRSANVQYPLEHLYTKTKDGGLKDYVIVIQTKPGDALLESTIRHSIANNSFQVTGIVSRINSYGNQSSCVADRHMKLYCYCKSYLNMRTKL
ncbi:hypothetical protein ANN_11579 [Periplaneta americana]|uniref:Uncharacterized protein n=1 Tax=Periplaneta americana TaxID=6978 RepID=A0ABQ8T6V2_PERAM|nr:hypothetical protein ANN_11579 [Periplaneta americana]